MLLNFWKSAKGGMTSAFALLLMPLLVPSLAAVQTTSYAGFQTRLHQSQTAALLFIAKQGDISHEDKMAFISQWMDANLVLSSGSKAISNEENENEVPKTESELELELISSYKPNNFIGNVMGEVFVDKTIPQQKVNAVRVRYPMEVVLHLDISGSVRLSGILPEIQEAMTDAIDDLFGDADEADDLRISLITLSSDVVMPREYALKLVKPSSWLIDTKTNSPEKTKKLQDILAYHGLRDLKDISNNGKGFQKFKIRRKTLSFLHKQAQANQSRIKTRQEVLDYAEHVDDKIVDLERDGFDIGVADGRKYLGGLNHTQDPSIVDPIDMMFIFNYQGINTYNFFLDKSIIFDGINKFSKNPKRDEYIGIFGLATGPYANVSIALNNKTEIINAINSAKIETTGGDASGMDEQLVWAFRLLSPNYSDIWGIENYPAPYNSKTEKRFIYFTSGPIAGYFKTTIDDSPNKPDDYYLLYKEVCRRMNEKGIKIYVIPESEGLVPNPTDIMKVFNDHCSLQDIYPERKLKGFNFYDRDLYNPFKEALDPSYYVKLE
ncbi:MAG: hypothetical protein LBT38_06740 [Deltaproteobacteria bacterium]|jgi:hypothetical protein|nr:hypothetical protein [Deltaproteobacteria bacterium]